MTDHKQESLSRDEQYQRDQDRLTHLVDPLTDPSSGDPPPAISADGERLGAIPLTRNAVADTEQAKKEGLDAAEHHAPTKAEKQSATPAVERAQSKTQQPSKDAPLNPGPEVRTDAPPHKASAPKAASSAPSDKSKSTGKSKK